MRLRLTAAAATAVILCSLPLFALIQGAGWFVAGIGAVLTVALAGTATRLPPVPAAAAATGLATMVSWPLLASSDWRHVAGGCAVIAAAAVSFTGLRAARQLAAVISYLGALLWYLNLCYASHQSLARLLPTAGSMHHLTVLASRGLAEQAFVPPVPGRPGLALVAAAGIGVVAVAVDVLAVWLERPAVAGLPLLVLFSAPVTTSAKNSEFGAAVVFCLGITGYLAMLAADGRERLRRWGRLVTVWQAPADAAGEPDTRALSTSGRRIGLAAVSLAVVAPLLLPGLHGHQLFHGSGGNGGGPGTGPGGPLPALPRPLVQLQGQLLSGTPQPILTYRTNNAGAADRYLQVFVLNFNSSDGKWELVPPGSASQPVYGPRSLPAPAGVTAAAGQQTVRLHITMAPVTSSGFGGKVGFLPLPYAPWKLQVPGSWRADDATLMVYSGQTSLSGLSYAVASKEAKPGALRLDSGTAILPPTGEQDYLGFASPLQATLRKLALRIAGTAATPYEQARALQNWFLAPGNFAYTLHPNLPNSPAGLLNFLTRSRRGYCQQFAFAMAALARLLGIPSRIAVGYTGGAQQSNGSWLVTTDDAHSWPELYFRGVGWLRFEPTPGGPGGQGTATTPTYAVPPGDGAALPPLSPKGGRGALAGANGRPATTHGGHTGQAGGQASQPGGAGRGGQPGGPGLALALALALAAAAAVAAAGPRAARSVIARRRWLRAHDDAAVATAAWLELRDVLTDIGVGVRASESPRAAASRVAAVPGLPLSAGDALTRLTAAVEQAQYASRPGPAGTLRADVATVRKALFRLASRQNRWLARLFPASTRWPALTRLAQRPGGPPARPGLARFALRRHTGRA